MKFTTKDSGERQEYNSGMRRDTQEGKPAFQFLVTDQPYQDQMLTRWAELMARGAEKYGARNWQLANSQEELDRFKASAFRHFMQWFCGETDEDHAAAVFFNVNAAEYVKHKRELLFDEEFDEWLRQFEEEDYELEELKRELGIDTVKGHNNY